MTIVIVIIFMSRDKYNYLIVGLERDLYRQFYLVLLFNLSLYLMKGIPPAHE